MALSRVRSSRRRFFRWRTRPAPIGSFSGRKSRRLKREHSCVGSRAFWLLVLPVSSVGLVSILRPLFVSSCTIHKEAALAPVAQIFLIRNLEKNSTAAIDGSSLVSEKSHVGSELYGLPERRDGRKPSSFTRADSATPFHRIVEGVPAGNIVKAELHRQPIQMTLFCVRMQT